MRYTLKNYQEDAVTDVLEKLRRAKDMWLQYKDISSFSLSATTGAGKTVMAAAVIEALFYGSGNFQADPGAVVLWFTDDPSLNEQTRRRIKEASDLLDNSRLRVIETSFTGRQLGHGKVYFLNRQKLARQGLLVRATRGDRQAPTFWDVLRNTIEDDALTLYVILDEAHRGMRDSNGSNEKETIVKRLVNGQGGVPPVPIVWGISATVERFSRAMERAKGRTQLPNVEVDPQDVQESGLLKDNILLDFPTERGRFETVLLRRATRLIKDATRRWDDHLGKQRVAPLLVVQMPNTPDDRMLLMACRVIRDEWPDLDSDAMANVFGEHEDLMLGSFRIPYVKPQDVQGRPHIRVLFAKDAVSTGWDCPRAEVLMSFRPASDRTHITQLLGRMVRTPLARRIEGDDLLNSVHCVLPHFNPDTANHVAELMMGNRDQDRDGTGGGHGRRVMTERNTIKTEPNQSVREEVWDAYDRVISQTIPAKASNPVQRLANLCQALSQDNLQADARKFAYRCLYQKLDGLFVQHKSDVEEHCRDVSEMEGQTLIARKREAERVSSKVFVEPADQRAIMSDFKIAYPIFTADLSNKYAQYLVENGTYDPWYVHIRIAALARIPTVGPDVHAEADRLFNEMISKHRTGIRKLNDGRQDSYDQIKGATTKPQPISLRRPKIRIEDALDKTGKKFNTRPNHLTCAPDGTFPIGKLNNMEVSVLDKEMAESGFMAWYRNRNRPSKDALAIVYESDEGGWKRMLPDFLFFANGDGRIVRPTIVDPHGYHFSDALPKLRGLAKYAEDFGNVFNRIDAVSAVRSGKIRVLDMQRQQTRTAVFEADSAESLYDSEVAEDYM